MCNPYRIYIDVDRSIGGEIVARERVMNANFEWDTIPQGSVRILRKIVPVELVSSSLAPLDASEGMFSSAEAGIAGDDSE